MLQQIMRKAVQAVLGTSLQLFGQVIACRVVAHLIRHLVLQLPAICVQKLLGAVRLLESFCGRSDVGSDSPRLRYA